MPIIIDGKKTSGDIYQEILNDITKLKTKPGLSIILVGSKSDSVVYVTMKEKMCIKLGIKSIVKRLPETISHDELLKEVDTLNNDDSIHGILIQLPPAKSYRFQ